MKNFLIKLLLFTVLFFVYDKFFLLVANQSAETEVDRRLEYLVNGEINKELIILGSSRGSRDIIAGQIEDSTGLSAYNLCYPGSNLEFHEFILRTLLKYNEHPEVLFLVVDDDIALLPAERTMFRLDRMYPLVKYSHVRNELMLRGENEVLFSQLFILNSLNKSNFDLRQKHFTPLDTIMSCGSMPISWQRVDEDWGFVSGKREYPIEQEAGVKVDAYKNILRMCEKLEIEVVVVFPPNFQTYSKAFEDRIMELSSEEVLFYKYKDNPIYTRREYYYDEEHLIKKGAVIFTNELIHFIRHQYPDMINRN